MAERDRTIILIEILFISQPVLIYINFFRISCACELSYIPFIGLFWKKDTARYSSGTHNCQINFKKIV